MEPEMPLNNGGFHAMSIQCTILINCTPNVYAIVQCVHVIHLSSCKCVCALLFGNVTFALITPKTIRGCVTA